MAQKCLSFYTTHPYMMSNNVKADVALDPVDVALLGMVSVMFEETLAK